MNPSFEQTLIEVWRQALVENAKVVALGTVRYSVRLTPKRGLRQVDFVFNGKEIRGLEQNPETKSRWAQMARSGKKVMQFLSDYKERVITVRKSKTVAGQRLIPLNRNAWNAILELGERAKKLAGSSLRPSWYVLPHAEGNSKPHPTQPMRTWRTAWRRITEEAGLSGLRFHDLRHHAITELAESSTSEQTIMSIAGHVSARMLAHYSHVRLNAKRDALAVLSDGPQTGGHVTRDVTNTSPDEANELQVAENMVDVTGIEPATPCLQTRQGKTLTALSGVAYTENQRNFRSLKCPEVVPNWQLQTPPMHGLRKSVRPIRWSKSSTHRRFSRKGKRSGCVRLFFQSCGNQRYSRDRVCLEFCIP